MADDSAIEWCDCTWQVLSGCRPKNPACRHCYSARLCGTRLKHREETKGLVRVTADGRYVFNGTVRFNVKRLDWPLRFRSHHAARAENRPTRIFVADRSDIGYEDVPDEWRDHIFGIESVATRHDFINLTKRWDNLARYLRGKAPLHNAWIGWSAHDQESFDEGWAAMKPLARAGWQVWCSLEPMLGPVDVRRALAEGLRWIVLGGESGGKDARPIRLQWVEAVEAACRAAGVPFFFKQWGAWHPCETGQAGGQLMFAAHDHLIAVKDGRRCAVIADNDNAGHGWVFFGKKRSGARLHGRLHQAWPETRGAA